LFDRNAPVPTTVQAVSDILERKGRELPGAVMLYHPLPDDDYWIVVQPRVEPGMYIAVDVLSLQQLSS